MKTKEILDAPEFALGSSVTFKGNKAIKGWGRIISLTLDKKAKIRIVKYTGPVELSREEPVTISLKNLRLINPTPVKLRPKKEKKIAQKITVNKVAEHYANAWGIYVNDGTQTDKIKSFHFPGAFYCLEDKMYHKRLR